MKKEARVYRLPTIDCNNGVAASNLDFAFPYYHLYITTDEEIKEGDWFLYDNKICKAEAVDNVACFVRTHLPNGLEFDCEFGGKTKKITATTDPKLTKGTNWVEADVQGHWECANCGEWTEDLSVKCKCKPVNKIPQSFIEEYCKAGGIDEVLVEYFDGQNNPKLDSNNCIIIHPAREKMYSREKVVTAFVEGFKACEEGNSDTAFFIQDLANKWIEENL